MNVYELRSGRLVGPAMLEAMRENHDALVKLIPENRSSAILRLVDAWVAEFTPVVNESLQDSDLCSE